MMRATTTREQHAGDCDADWGDADDGDCIGDDESWGEDDRVGLGPAAAPLDEDDDEEDVIF